MNNIGPDQHCGLDSSVWMTSDIVIVNTSCSKLHRRLWDMTSDAYALYAKVI